MIYLHLFLAFAQVGTFSLGGGYAALPFIQSLVVGHYGWLTLSEFSNLIVIAAMTPGSIAVNAATFVGLRLGGIGGALVATLGVALPSLVIVSLLAFLYLRYRQTDTMQTVLSSLRPAVVGLIACAAATIFLSAAFSGAATALLNVHWPNVALAGLAFLALRKFRFSPIPVMLGCGAVGLVLHALGAGI